MQRRNSSSQILIVNFSKASFFHQRSQLFLIRKPRNRVRQIFVCAPRTAYQTTKQRQQLRKIDPKKRTQQECSRLGKLQHCDPAARFQDPQEFPEALVNTRQISQSEGDSGCLKRTISERKVESVSLNKRQ